MERIEAHHWLGDPFNKAVILFKDIIEIFDLPDFNDFARSGELQDRVNSLQASQVSATLVNDHLLRNAVACDSLFKEPSHCSQIPSFGQHEIKGLSVAINRSIQIGPFAFGLDIGLVNTPRTGCAAFT